MTHWRERVQRARETGQKIGTRGWSNPETCLVGEATARVAGSYDPVVYAAINRALAQSMGVKELDTQGKILWWLMDNRLDRLEDVLDQLDDIALEVKRSRSA